MLRISVDLEGGKNAPFSILEAASKFNDVKFIFFGTAKSYEIIESYEIKNFEFFETLAVLKEDERLSAREMQNSSMYRAIAAVKDNLADAVISAGPSGYYLLLCKKILGTIENISRPALASLIPTLKKPAIMMDLGANISCSQEDLFRFAVLGKALAKFWLDYDNPRIGFVNVGEELGKGPEIVRNATEKFQKLNPDSFVGFIEPNYIMLGTHDVIITDGFTGNCMLKLGEGMMIFFKETLKRALHRGFLAKICGFLLKRKLSKLHDPSKLNGAIWAGVNGCAVKSHGSADALGFESAIRFCIKVASKKDEMIKSVREYLLACK